MSSITGKLKKILEHYEVIGSDNYGGEYRITHSDGVYTIKLTTYTIDDSDTRKIYEGNYKGLLKTLKRNGGIGGFDVVAPRSMNWEPITRYGKFGIPLRAKLNGASYNRFGDTVFFILDGQEYYLYRGQPYLFGNEQAVEWTSAPMLSRGHSGMEPMIGGINHE